MADGRATASEMQDQVLNAIPATGEISYRNLHNALNSTGKGQALAYYRALKKAGRISVRLVQNPDGTVDHLVSRA